MCNARQAKITVDEQAILADGNLKPPVINHSCCSVALKVHTNRQMLRKLFYFFMVSFFQQRLYFVEAHPDAWNPLNPLSGKNHDGCPTQTSIAQKECEENVSAIFKSKLFEQNLNSSQVTEYRLTINRNQHVRGLLAGLEGFPRNCPASLQSMQPWCLYWMLHSLAILKALHYVKSGERQRLNDFLQRCQCCPPATPRAQNQEAQQAGLLKDVLGGFGGGPGQEPHLGTTYAALGALKYLNSGALPGWVDRPALARFLAACRAPPAAAAAGAAAAPFRACAGPSEADARTVYLALAAARHAGLPEENAEEGRGVAAYLRSLQTHEGGCGGEPGAEAHAGTTYCALAAASLLGDQVPEEIFDLRLMLRWLKQRQRSLEGGFNGRTNKLVDSCYSFWVLASMEIIIRSIHNSEEAMLYGPDSDTTTPTDSQNPLFKRQPLLFYLLVVAQDHGSRGGGGFRDKPGAQVDYYHTCYALSALPLLTRNLSSPLAPLISKKAGEVRKPQESSWPCHQEKRGDERDEMLVDFLYLHDNEEQFGSTTQQTTYHDLIANLKCHDLLLNIIVMENTSEQQHYVDDANTKKNG